MFGKIPIELPEHRKAICTTMRFEQSLMTVAKVETSIWMAHGQILNAGQSVIGSEAANSGTFNDYPDAGSRVASDWRLEVVGATMWRRYSLISGETQRA